MGGYVAGFVSSFFGSSALGGSTLGGIGCSLGDCCFCTAGPLLVSGILGDYDTGAFFSSSFLGGSTLAIGGSIGAFVGST